MGPLESLQYPSHWDMVSSEPSLELLAQLQNLEASPLRDARLAYVHLMLGRLDETQKIVQVSDHPLAQAVQMAVWIEQHRFQEVLSAETKETDMLPADLGAEAKARIKLERSKAQFHLYHYREALSLARQAETQARALGMQSLSLVANVHGEECHYSIDESELVLADREADLREWVSSAPSQESRVMAYMALVRLLSRQGLYDKAMRFTLEVPRPLNGQHFVELMLVLNNLDDQSDWAKLDSRYQGRLHAIKGMLRADADFILAGSPPDSSFHPRPRSEWTTFYAWAHLNKGNFSQALEHFEDTLIPRCEWDLRFVRNMGLIELFVLAPGLMADYNLEQLCAEALWLLQERISPHSLILRLVPRAMPYGTVLLLALSQTSNLAESASSQILLAAPNGLTIAGVTHANSSAMVRLLEDQVAEMSPAALRTNRHRLRLFLQQFGQPCVVRGSLIHAALKSLAESSANPPQWKEASERFAKAFSFVK